MKIFLNGGRADIELIGSKPYYVFAKGVVKERAE